MSDRELTPKQEKFARKYIELGNASEAYRQSYDAQNMLPESVWAEASRTLANPIGNRKGDGITGASPANATK